MLILKALADEVRLNLVRKVAKSGKPKLTCDIIKACTHLSSLSQPTISHHINKLVDAQILSEEKVDRHKIYTLNLDLLKKVGIDINKL